MADSKLVTKPTDVRLHKQKRAALTRQELLRSARTIFARDGFDQARLEDIAALAGKTRGAFYANFKDKEDVFCAIFEEDVDRDMDELLPTLAALPTVDERIVAVADYLSGQSRHRERILLNLEFKLYAIRHPRKRKRLADLHGAIRLCSSVPELRELLPHLMEQSQGTQLADSLAIGAILDGLALNHLFDPEALNSQEMARYLKLCLQGSLASATARSASSRMPIAGKTGLKKAAVKRPVVVTKWLSLKVR